MQIEPPKNLQTRDTKIKTKKDKQNEEGEEGIERENFKKERIETLKKLRKHLTELKVLNLDETITNSVSYYKHILKNYAR